MLESLPEVPVPLKVFLVLIFVLALIIATTWLVRRYGADRLAGAAGRGRQPRLAVVDQVYMPDGRRKLVIVRRDNVEHLVMIGGPTDVVVEQNIVRAASRDKGDAALGRNLANTEPLARPVPLGEGTPFPLQPESNGRAARPVQEEAVQWTWPPHTETPAQSPARAEPRLDKVEPPAKPADFSATPREPSFMRPITPPPAARAAPTPPAPAPAAAAPAEKIEKPAPIAAPEDNLAEMANRLETSIRRPPEPRAVETPAPLKPEPVVPPALRADPEQRPAPPEPTPAKAEAPAKGAFESLEEEMASLLGRPPGKT